ncbi:Oligopeptide transport system permease protein OppB (TC 3.A.1.5.1) [hydrothermal vent metagenome]|uniref:Oligopeptide transport system permease protein OppB (TC 3.A.1.5.1) n=1 Tax=hydrothermal vent metagenome TaxID=652676 RepID=A0A3B0U703_9ZZZZ
MTFLKVTDLAVEFTVDKRTLVPVSGISFEMEPGEVLGMVGETGSGKSLTAHAIMGLTSLVGGKVSGNVQFGNVDLLTLSRSEIQTIRGAKISFIPQNPMTSLDPVYRVGDQIVEGLRKHLKINKWQAKRQALDLMEQLQIPNPERVFEQYPHQLSGGLKQRIVIAIGIGTKPQLLIADEPTTALDVTVQAQIIRLFKELTVAKSVGLLLITHDLGVIAQVCDKIVVLYAGNLVEYGDIKTVFKNPKHPYTKALLDCIPYIGMKKGSLRAIQGNVPASGNFPSGCRYNPRCPFAVAQCKKEMPAMIELEGGARVACNKYSRETELV